MNKIDICGVLVHASPGQAEQVKQGLEEFSGVDVHSITKDSRLVVTVEAQGDELPADTVSHFNSVAGVLSAAMIYQHFEPIEENNPLEVSA